MNLKNSAHNETAVKFASSKDEVNRAFELAKDIFIKDPNSQSSTFKELSWDIKADNIFKKYNYSDIWLRHYRSSSVVPTNIFVATKKI